MSADATLDLVDDDSIGECAQMSMAAEYSGTDYDAVCMNVVTASEARAERKKVQK